MENASLAALCPDCTTPGQRWSNGGGWSCGAAVLRTAELAPERRISGLERLSLQGGMFICPHLELDHGVCPFPEVTAQLCQG